MAGEFRSSYAHKTKEVNLWLVDIHILQIAQVNDVADVKEMHPQVSSRQTIRTLHLESDLFLFCFIVKKDLTKKKKKKGYHSLGNLFTQMLHYNREL